MNVIAHISKARIARYCCPTCGGDIGEAIDLPLIRGHITQSSHLLLFDALAKKPGTYMSKETLINALYGHRADGGPDGNGFYVFIGRLRKQIEEFGWTIASSRPRGGRGVEGAYRLIPMERGA